MFHSVEEFLSRLNNVSRSGSEWKAQCPCYQRHNHKDHDPSLTVGFNSTTNRILLCCHSQGHTEEEICAELGISVSDLYLNGEDKKQSLIEWIAKKDGLRYVCQYSYCYGSYQDGLAKIRFENSKGEKTFKWICEDPSKKTG